MPPQWGPGPPAPSGGNNKAGIIVVLVLLVVGVGAFFLLSGDDDDSASTEPGGAGLGDAPTQPTMPDPELDPDLTVPGAGDSPDVDLPDSDGSSGGGSAGSSSGAPSGSEADDCTSPTVTCSELAEDCSTGDMDACDRLFYMTTVGSAWEEYGATCGGLATDLTATGRCAETFG